MDKQDIISQLEDVRTRILSTASYLAREQDTPKPLETKELHIQRLRDAEKILERIEAQLKKGE